MEGNSHSDQDKLHFTTKTRQRAASDALSSNQKVNKVLETNFNQTLPGQYFGSQKQLPRKSLHTSSANISVRSKLQQSGGCDFGNTVPCSKNAVRNSRGGVKNKILTDAGMPTERSFLQSRTSVEAQMNPDIAHTLRALDRYLQLRNMRAADLHRLKDMEELRKNSPDFSIQEFEKVLLKTDLNLTKRQLKDTSYYVDLDGNGTVDVAEIEAAIRQAKRLVVPHDPMRKIANIVRNDPFANILNIPTSSAFMKVGKS